MRRLVFLTLVACSSSSNDRVYTLDDLDLDRAIGLPVSGDGKLVVSKSLFDPPDWTKVTGRATFQCEDCTIGDDHTTLHEDEWYPKQPGGVELQFGHLTFTTIDARADVAEGRLHATATVTSPDVGIAIRLDGTLAQRREDAMLNGCIHFKPTAALGERDPKMYSLLGLTGAEQDDQGWFNIALEGRFSELKRLARPCQI